MELQRATPCADLAHWIHSFREYTFSPDDREQFTSLPGTGAELWLKISGDLRISGQPASDGLLCLRSRQLQFQQKGLRVFSIRFRAGSLPFFVQRPLAELVDHYTPLERQWNETSLQQLKALRRSPHFDEQCLLAERFVLSRLSAHKQLEKVHRLASSMYERSADFALGEYAEEHVCDRRHLSRQFRDIQGTTTKHFHRLCRFERFLRDALFAAKPSLSGLAADHGYYDQAHMQHDFREFSQMSPARLLAQKEARLFYSPRLIPN
jgi:AraC-like DNA-binding protein